MQNKYSNYKNDLFFNNFIEFLILLWYHLNCNLKKERNMEPKTTEKTSGGKLGNYIAIILDRSGSMNSIREEARQVFNEQVATINKSAKGMKNRVCLVTFSTVPDEPIFWLEDPEILTPFDESQYQPNGMTALFDTVGTTVEKLKKVEDAADEDVSFLIIIISDGQENNSKTFNSEKIAALIKECQNTGRWTFTYLGANQDLSDVSRHLEIPRDNIAGFESTRRGMARGSRMTSSGIEDYMLAKMRGTKQSRSFFGAPEREACANDLSEEYPISFENEHFIATIDGKRVLIDTGSPMSLSDGIEFNLMGKQYRFPRQVAQFNIKEISELIGLDIDVLIGTDVLLDHNCAIIYSERRAVFFNRHDVFHGKTIQIQAIMGVPVVNININGNNHRAFLDSCAKLSYVSKSVAESFPEVGDEEDFYPMIGRFITKTYDVAVSFGGAMLNLKCGVLPQTLSSLLSVTGVDAIIGVEIFNYFDISFELKNNKAYLL